MSDDIGHLHHVGLVVHDMEEALAVYRHLGFVLPPPSYPLLARDGGEPQPFGAANTHAYFGRNFIELVTIASEGARIPEGATFVPLQVPAEHVPHVTEIIDQTVSRLAAYLGRFEGLHRLVFSTRDAEAVAERLSSAGVPNSGVNTTQRPVETDDGSRVETIRHIEISGGPDGADVEEAILAVAELQSLHGVHVADHPNGAVDLVDAVLCVGADELSAVESRYEAYLDRSAERSGPARVFKLDGSRLTILADNDLDSVLPGERAPTLPALVGYGVAVRDAAATDDLLRANGFSPAKSAADDLFVPADAALGAAVIFQQRS